MVYEGISEYASKKILDHLVGKTSFTMPTNNYVALFNGDPLNAGVELANPSATDYAREQTSASDWTAAAFVSPTTSAVSAADIDFGVAGAAWGTVDYFAVYDASTDGNMLYCGPLEVSRSIQLNDPVKFPAGELKVRLTQATV